MLLQDEVVLCRDGRLEAGIYEFHFDLEFPKEDLPSSIDVRSYRGEGYPADPSPPLTAMVLSVMCADSVHSLEKE